MAIESRNPTTGKIFRTYRSISSPELTKKIGDAYTASFTWRDLTFSQRAKFLLRVAKDLRTNSQKYGRLISLEMGKPISQAVAEVEKCAWGCEYFAENAEKLLKVELIPTDAQKSYTRFDALGVILGVMPWNFPFWQVFRFAAPTLMAGNVTLIKHASNVPGCSTAIEAAFKKAGFPKGVYTNLLASSNMVEKIIADPRVAGVSLTGSESAGRSIGEISGKNIKKLVLELGGSDPFIVLDDVDIANCCSLAVHAKMNNTGQSCIAAKRFIILNKVADKFLKTFVSQMENLKVGDPLSTEVLVGPLARSDLVDTLDQQVKESIKSGSQLLLGGKKIKGSGYFYEPTVLLGAQPGSPAYDEELFGPVATIIIVKDVAEAIRIANDTKYGLGASIWTKDRKKAEKIAARLESGFVSINSAVKSDPRLPFGGVKNSGHGRELGVYGIKEFVNVKTVTVR